MASPVPTNRVTPSGHQMDEGLFTKVTIGKNTSIKFWEKDIKPPPVDNGEPIDQTTQFNTFWKTASPRKLNKLDAVTLNAGYDPFVYNHIINIIGQETTITVTFPTGDQLAFFGYLQKFDPSDLKEGEKPMASVTIQPTNRDPLTKQESAPTFTNGSGTGS